MIANQTRRLALAAALAALLVSRAYASSAIESVVPNDCVMLLRVKSLHEWGQQLKGTALGQAITKTELASAGLELVSGGRRFFSALVMGVPWSTVQDQFFSDVAVVIFDRVPGPRRKPPIAFIFDVSAGPGQAKTLVEDSILPHLKAINPKLSVSKDTYQGVTLHRLQDRQKPPLYGAFVAQVFVMGNEDGVRRIIDGSANPTQTLTSHEAYREVSEDVAVEVGAVCYINAQMLVEKDQPMLAAKPKKPGGLAGAGDEVV